MFDWRARYSDPTVPDLFRGLDAHLWSITRFPETSRIEYILEACRDREVLDIGAGEHDPSFYSADNWEHGRIAAVARRIVAVELDPKLCEHYNAAGFDFRCVDATSDVDLGERFERIFVGDVIEHVSDPVRLLQFVDRHLAEDGVAIFTTPNPFAPRFRQTRSRFGLNYVAANAEHTFWLSASCMHELAWRAGIDLTGLVWPLYRKPKSGLARTMARLGRRLQVRLRGPEAVYPEYMFEFRRRRT